jgi:UPF0271 protein
MPDSTLVSRREPGAVLHDADLIAERMVRLATTGELEAIDGSTLHIEAASICLHGDTDGAVQLAKAVRNALEGAGIELRSFA